ncbi:MAG: 4-hydroxyphenylpyruvate dioxygenase [Cyanobacteria bacterium P01_E01_bin.6]
MDFDSVTFFLDDIAVWQSWFTDTLGFVFPSAQAHASLHPHTKQSIHAISSDLSGTLRHKPIQVRLASSSDTAPDVEHYLNHHPPGVADVGFRVKDLDHAYGRAIQAGAKPIQPITTTHLPGKTVNQATVSGWGDLRHTLTEYIDHPNPQSPRSATSYLYSSEHRSSRPDSAQTPTLRPPQHAAPDFSAIDHVVINVPCGEMEQASAWYERAFGFTYRQTFAIQTPYSGLRSVVMVHPDGNATLPINEPASPHSQIQEFLDVNQGTGVQHIALSTPNIVQTIMALREKGLAFLSVPSSYYEQLPIRPGFQPSPIDWGAIAQQGILVDWQNDVPDALLFQIFTQPIFKEPTFFFEIIQRQSYFNGIQYQRAEGFGEGNFQALFEAIEREQQKRGSLPLSTVEEHS